MIYPVQSLLLSALNLYFLVIIIDAVLSWLVAFDIVNTRNRFVGTVGDVCNRLTTPVLNPIRKFVPAIGGVDLSPVVLILGMQFVMNLIRIFVRI